MSAGAPLLEIDAKAFREGYDRGPFRIRHRLAEHPLFAMPRLVELGRRLPADSVEYNAGDVPVGLDPAKTPRTGLSVEETIRRIQECRSWMVLKHVEQDPEFRDLLYRCLAEIAEHAEALDPGMTEREGHVFVSSPGSVTPIHLDHEQNFLLQVRGTKTIHQWDRADRSVLSEADLERIHDGGHRNIAYRDEFEAKAKVFELRPGDGLHFPVHAPHWVKNGPAVSVSFSVTWKTPAVLREGALWRINGRLRRRGFRPSPPGAHPARDAVKWFAYRAASGAKRLVTGSKPPREPGY